MAENLHGFRLERQEEIEDISSTARIFTHEKSGARLLHLENDDENKVFSISFKTLPPDSSGMAHILEHSVLNGSRKFPVKEPFVELLKGSLNTFLNAMTFPDKTVYPIASKNEKDFFNLMDVYLDAVFYPILLETPAIFQQEGWHYSYDKKSDKLAYNGVVYNEMQGVFSSPESILRRKIKETLFPENIYGNDSGGIPEFIPDLDFEGLRSFYETYYHPANSFIFLYGNGDFQEQLEFINDKYLAAFSKSEGKHAIKKHNPPATAIDLVEHFSISGDEDTKDKAYISLNFVTGLVTDSETILGLEILERILMGTPASPLKNALLKADISKDSFSYFESYIYQPIFCFAIKHTDPSRKSEFQEIVLSTLGELAEKGIDRTLIESAIHAIEFDLREAETGRLPKGLVYNFYALNNWLYEDDPLRSLKYLDLIESIKSKSKDGFFEGLIRNFFLSNSYQSTLTLLPEKNLEEKKSLLLTEKLANYRKSLTDAELNNLVQSNEKLKERQEAPDQPEDLAKIPRLALSDIGAKVEPIPLEILSGGDATLLQHRLDTQNIVYLRLFFDADHLSQDELCYVPLLSYLYGKLDTKEYPFEELAKQIDLHTGGINYGLAGFNPDDQFDRLTNRLRVSAKFLDAKSANANALIEEVLKNTDFTNKERIGKLLSELKSRLEMSVVNSGHVFAQTRCLSYITDSGAIREQLEGISQYRFISDLLAKFESNFDEIRANLEALRSKIIRRNNLVMSYAADDKSISRSDDTLAHFRATLADMPSQISKLPIKQNSNAEAFTIPGNVVYVASAANFKKSGLAYHGSSWVLKNILSREYLWNRVRVQGGAYGAFNSIDRNGNVVFSSYRDPNISSTLDSFASAGEFVRSLDLSKSDLDKFIIGAISNFEPHRSPTQKASVAVARYFSKVGENNVQEVKDEILATTLADLKSLMNYFQDTANNSHFCVVGSEAKIKEAGSLFSKTESALST